MRITNTTPYSTESLRRLFSAGLAHCGATSTGLVVEVVSCKQDEYCHGTASLGVWRESFSLRSDEATTGRRKRLIQGRWAKMWVNNPNRSAVSMETLTKRVAQVWEHEVKHLLGIEHADMSEALYHCRQDVPWAEGIVLEVAAPTVKPAVDRLALDAQHAHDMFNKWHRKVEAATTHLKKWERKMKRLDKRLVARANLASVEGALDSIVLDTAAGRS